MKYISLMFSALFLAGCTGQTFLLPVATRGKDGIAGVKAAPVFRNSGNMDGVQFALNTPYGSINFSADKIDNASSTTAMLNGVEKIVGTGGRTIGQPLIFGPAGASAVKSIAGSASGAVRAFAK